MGERRPSDYDSTRESIEKVYRHLVRQQGGWGMDFLHAAIIKLVLKLRSGEVVNDPAAYARTVASHEKLNERRRESTHARHEHAIIHAVESVRSEPDLPAEEAEEARRARVVLESYRAELDEAQREVLTLHFELNLSVAEVARRLGRPPTTLRNWVREMRRELVLRLSRSEEEA